MYRGGNSVSPTLQGTVFNVSGEVLYCSGDGCTVQYSASFAFDCGLLAALNQLWRVCCAAVALCSTFRLRY